MTSPVLWYTGGVRNTGVPVSARLGFQRGRGGEDYDRVVGV